MKTGPKRHSRHILNICRGTNILTHVISAATFSSGSRITDNDIAKSTYKADLIRNTEQFSGQISKINVGRHGCVSYPSRIKNIQQTKQVSASAK